MLGGVMARLFVVVLLVLLAIGTGARAEDPAATPLTETMSGAGGTPQSLTAAVIGGLGALGYDAGPPRDEIDGRARGAIKAFQRDHGLPESGRLSKRLVKALADALKEKRQAKGGPSGPSSGRATGGAPQAKASGTGFVVSSEGHVITNRHVIEGCREVRVGPGERIDVVAVAKDADLALLRLRRPRAESAIFRDDNKARPGEEIVVLGYPLYGLLGADAIVTTGTINALAGIRNDRSQMQISAPVQPGNSGGPVLDAAGHIVGVVVARLDALRVAKAIGTLPKNVNFAINEATARRFLDALHVPYKVARSSRKAAAFTVLLICYD